MIFFKGKCDGLGRKESILNLSVLSSTVIIKTTYLSFISTQKGSNYTYLLEASLQMLNQEKFGSCVPTDGLSLGAHMRTGMGWLTK